MLFSNVCSLFLCLVSSNITVLAKMDYEKNSNQVVQPPTLNLYVFSYVWYIYIIWWQYIACYSDFICILCVTDGYTTR